jgi:hypothetical protein
MLIAA